MGNIISLSNPENRGEKRQKNSPNKSSFPDSEEKEKKRQKTLLGDHNSQRHRSSLSAGWDYEVFLSFRGEDTRKGFVDFLYHALIGAGIRTFRDNEELRLGEKIGQELISAIEQSKIAIAVISSGYASSKWCLYELVHMVKCMRLTGLRIFPIFYNVTPSEVKHQTGSFQGSFTEYTKECDKITVKQWREALIEVTTLKGWEKDKVANGHEGELLNLVVSEVCITLQRNNVDIIGPLVGMDHHVKEMIRLLDVDCNDVRVIGIHGMGGIGKTTLAKVIYNQLCDHFQQRCAFIENVREEATRSQGLIQLQNKLRSDILWRKSNGNLMDKGGLRKIKVLIVLDDVGEYSQLDTIIGGLDSFDSGSRVIVTTRDKDVLRDCEENMIYELKEMDFDHSLQLFCSYAFKRDYPPETYEEISKEVASTASGLPLSIVVIGSHLYKKKRNVWNAALKRLKEIPHGKVQEKLRISFDKLQSDQKQIFLDIACLFIGQDKGNAVYMWDSCGFYPEEGLEVLQSLHLVKIRGDNIIDMHDQLRDLGRDIVRQENLSNPSIRSRVWSHEDAMDTLRYTMGKKRVEALRLHWDYYSNGRVAFDPFPCEAFKSLSNMRYLQMDNGNLDGDFNGLLVNLRWLRWHFCPENIVFTNFCPRRLVVLDLSYSRISNGWENLSQIMVAKNLKVLDLSYCFGLRKTPEFSRSAVLERLILKKCIQLEEIGPSIIHLKSLAYLDIRDCHCLKKLPPEFASMRALTTILLDKSAIQEIPTSKGFMRKLETLSATHCESITEMSSIGHLQSLLDIRFDYSSIHEVPESMQSLVRLRRASFMHCTSLSKLPDSVGSLVKLQHLALDGCSSLTGVPESIGSLHELQYLSLSGCESMTDLPQSVGGLESLVELNMEHVHIIELPDAIGNLSNLRILNVGHSHIQKLPKSIGKLGKLEKLEASHCCSFNGELPEEIWSLSSLRILNLYFTKVSRLPTSIAGLSSLVTLHLVHRDNGPLPQVLQLPIGLTDLIIIFSATTLDCIVNLLNLKSLCLQGCTANVVEIPRDMSRLSKLEKLTLQCIDNIRSIPLNIVSFSRLKELSVCGCEKLQFIPDPPTGLFELWIQQCESIERLSNLSNLRNLAKLSLYSCSNLIELEGIERLESLTSFHIRWCTKLSRLDGLEHLELLGELEITDCESIETLPNLSALKRLQDLCIKNCPKLSKIRGVEGLISLRIMKTSKSIILEGLDDLSENKMLHGMYKPFTQVKRFEGHDISDEDSDEESDKDVNVYYEAYTSDEEAYPSDEEAKSTDEERNSSVAEANTSMDEANFENPK